MVGIGGLVWLAEAVSPEGTVARQIANAHVLFNLLGVALFIGFVPWISKGLYRLIPHSRRVNVDELADTGPRPA